MVQSDNNPELFDFFRKTFKAKEKKGIKARIYVPDRDVFRDAREKEGRSNRTHC